MIGICWAAQTQGSKHAMKSDKRATAALAKNLPIRNAHSPYDSLRRTGHWEVVLLTHPPSLRTPLVPECAPLRSTGRLVRGESVPSIGIYGSCRNERNVLGESRRHLSYGYQSWGTIAPHRTRSGAQFRTSH
jgi:hypothetical protein